MGTSDYLSTLILFIINKKNLLTEINPNTWKHVKSWTAYFGKFYLQCIEMLCLVSVSWKIAFLNKMHYLNQNIEKDVSVFILIWQMSEKAQEKAIKRFR